MANMIGLSNDGLQLVPADAGLNGVAVNLVQTDVTLSGVGTNLQGAGDPWLAPLPAGYGYRYWVDGNGNNQLILYRDLSGNYYAMYAPLP